MGTSDEGGWGGEASVVVVVSAGGVGDLVELSSTGKVEKRK